MTTKKKAASVGANTTSTPALVSKHTSKKHGLDTLLSRLDKVRHTGPGRWIARCPSHADKSPSLAIRETDDGTILIHCFAGCSPHEVVSAVGLDLGDLFSARHLHCKKPERLPFPVVDVLRAIAFEVIVVCAASRALLNGKPLSETDHARLILAATRIQNALSMTGVVNG